MPFINRAVAGLGNQMLALTIGIVCGVAAYLAGLPLPWMLGALIGNTVAAMSRIPVRAPVKLRPFVIPIIGVLLGAGVTPQILDHIATWSLTVLLLPLFLGSAAAGSFTVYRKLGGYDTVTAFYASMPGGLNDMVVLGAEAGGDERRIALAHAARILVVIVFVALFFGLVLGVNSGSRSAARWVSLDALSVADYAILGVCAAAGTWLGHWAKLPAAPIFGPMILSGIAHFIGWVDVPPPTLMIILAQVTLGTIIGTRFAGATFAQVGRDLALATLATLVMLAVAIVFAVMIAWASGVPVSQAFLAYSPGGLTEMSLLALALDQDVTYVSLMHIFRITMVIAMAPLAFRWRRR